MASLNPVAINQRLATISARLQGTAEDGTRLAPEQACEQAAELVQHLQNDISTVGELGA
jgi:hypothetical protein